ncbi:tetratricopeptide repeat protein [Roseospira navarrensis]|uniref:Tetratricopeptide repeat protein n=1 Tax=Roseospira navarrensis TaxID=140058 RepID=A0A7X1ZDY7_9PROT|nr:tetratricopeptide repeat protein [Roseospira navarrensis]MQX36567.1 hypothetical protein [Roseospira navarrensis]
MARARTLFRAGQDEAVLALGVVADRMPDGPDKGQVMRLIGLAALRLNDTDEARRWLAPACDLLGADDTAATIALGGACLGAGALEQAEAAFRDALGRTPMAVGAAIGLARTLETRGDAPGALSAWRRAMAALVALTPAQSDGWMLGLPASVTRPPLEDQARVAESAGDPAAAAALRHRLRAVFPDGEAAEAVAAPAAPAPGPADTGPLVEITGGQDPHDLMDRARDADAHGRPETALALVRDAGRLAVHAPGPPDDDRTALALEAAEFLRTRGETMQATALLDALLEHRPADPPVLHAHGVARRAAGDDGAALAAIEAVRDRLADTDHGPLLALWAVLLEDRDRLDEAAALSERAIAAAPGAPSSWQTLARVADHAGDTDRALAACHGALIRDPALAWAHDRIARVLESRNQLDPAMAHARRAVAVAEAADPDGPETRRARLALAHGLLKRGDWAEGWAAYEARPGVPLRPEIGVPAPAWTGDMLEARRLLIRSERTGLIDEVMGLRLAPAAVRRAGGVPVLEVDPRLMPLVARAEPDATVVAAADPPDPALHDPAIGAQAPVGSLARLIGPDPGAGVTAAPTLAADDAWAMALRASYLAEADARTILVGLCWAPQSARPRPDRLIPVEAWAPLASVPGVRFVPLRPDGSGADMERFTALAGIDVLTAADEGDAFRDDAPNEDGPGETSPSDPDDMDALAARIAAMDAVVTIDGLVAHLAGAMAVPSIVVLAHAADWRWGLEGPRSVWYPAVTLARQPVPGDWATPMHRTAAALGRYRAAALAGRAAE